MSPAGMDQHADEADGLTAVELWGRFVDTRAPALRDSLARHYDEFARILAAKAYSGRFSLELEFDDYLQFARIGLLEALDRFDPGRSVKFETFASRRVTGAILNGVESLSERQKQVSVRQQVLRDRAQAVGKGVSARADDVLERIGDVAIGFAVGFLLEGTAMYASEDVPYEKDAYHGVELKQLRGRIHDTVKLLPEQEQRVITLHYLQQQPFETIAKNSGVTKGRISQIHRAALTRLREMLKGSGLNLDL